MRRTCSVWLLLLCATGAAAVCDLRIGEPKPIVVKKFGSKTAVVKRSLTDIQLSPNESITFHCPTGISVSQSSGQPVKINAETAELLCMNDGIYLDDHQIIQHRSSATVYCSGGFTQTLYESNRRLRGCPAADAMTLIIGYKLNGLPDVKQLGICYDLGTSRPRFLSYLAYAPRNLLLERQTGQELDRLKLDTYLGSLSKYFRFPTNSEFQQLVSNQKQLGQLYDGKLFEYGSLLQEPQLSKELSNYADMLSIVWLRALRTGNWQHWLDALRTANGYTEGAAAAPGVVASCRGQFDVRLGVSGVATLPIAESCNASRSLLLLDSAGNGMPVPAHIWAHVRALQPTGTIADEFVVVAHNSPYYTVAELGSFCADICAEIPWLRESLFGQLHLVPQYGVVNCCRMDQLHKLVDFSFPTAAAAAATPTAATPPIPTSSP
ncbi:uncharacterized protein LOC6586162 [Drosophila mojavensis]|uniref:Uncharacterized protein n=1 Tax=Drosophila mojavensis TaxID=7230 RepID=B4L7R2_DROMO|nr:uncharacterized protein LOC6586162 [Drosophila mojavensis]EDW05775.1 uncharacterized protein Dmoj_GI10894 [Drosophila mojavensis]